AMHDYPLQCFWNVESFIELAQWRRLFLEMAEYDHDRPTRKRRLSRKRFIDYATKRIDVRPRVQMSTTTLLWAHIKRRTKDISSLSQSFGRCVFCVQHFSNAKIYNFAKVFSGSCLSQNNIAWLQVTMDDISLMCVAYSVTYLNEDFEHPLHV